MTQVMVEQAELMSNEPMKVARWLLDKTEFRTPRGHRGLWVYRGEPVVWREGRWESTGWEEMEKRVWLALEDARVTKKTRDAETGETETTSVRLRPNKHMVGEVCEAIAAVASVPAGTVMPFWAGGDEVFDARWAMAFEDVVLDLKTGVTVERDETWFGAVIVPVRWEDAKGAACPTWEKCLAEWGGGEEGWGEVVERMLALWTIAWREYARWFLLTGKARGGKGTVCRVGKRLMGGVGLFPARLSTLASQFGKDGLQAAQVCVVSEVTDLSQGPGEEVGSLVKDTVGRDDVSIQRKYLGCWRGRLEALMVLVGNKVPRLPDESQGLSGKMVPVSFQHSFLGKEDFRLDERLEAEVAGIARRVAEAGMRMAREGDPRKVLEMSESGREIVEGFTRKNNLVLRFIRDRFVESATSFVKGEELREQMDRWCWKHKVKLPCSRRDVPAMVAEECPWPVRKGRHGGDGGPRGLFGLGVRMVARDEDEE